MKSIRISMALLMCLMATVAIARTGADIEVSYRYSHPVQTMRNAEPDVTNQYILLTDGNHSKFYSPKTEYIDSIESTPEGFEKFNTFKRICYEKKQSDQIPRVDGSFYITKSNNDEKIHTYECFMATADYHGRKWTAWFAPEIPVSDGPWKLCGLPGIILQAECDGGQYRFVADGIQQARNPEYRIYGKEKWEPIKREEFWLLRRECLENPSRNRGVAGYTIVYNGMNYTKYLPKEIVDYIETDY